MIKTIDTLEEYDAGCLNNYGGGNVDWWHDYIRAELARAYEFYLSQLEAAPEVKAAPIGWMLTCQTLGGDLCKKLSWTASGSGQHSGVLASEDTAKYMINPTPLYSLEDIGIIRADVLALCEAAEQYALNAQCEIAEWVSQKHGYQKDADEIAALAKRISERLRGSDANTDTR